MKYRLFLHSIHKSNSDLKIFKSEGLVFHCKAKFILFIKAKIKEKCVFIRCHAHFSFTFINSNREKDSG